MPVPVFTRFGLAVAVLAGVLLALRSLLGG